MAWKVSLALLADPNVSAEQFHDACVIFLVPLMSDIKQFYFGDMTPKRPIETSQKTVKPIPLSKFLIYPNSIWRVIKRNVS